MSADLKGKIDRYPAIVLLHHDLDREMAMPEIALQSDVFYIGARGSRRTHEKRVLRLRVLGYEQSAIDRIKAPIGAFGPARNANALTISSLADLTMTRRACLARKARPSRPLLLPSARLHVALGDRQRRTSSRPALPNPPGHGVDPL